MSQFLTKIQDKYFEGFALMISEAGERYGEPPWFQVFPDLECSRLRMSINFAILEIRLAHEEEQRKRNNAKRNS